MYLITNVIIVFLVFLVFKDEYRIAIITGLFIALVHFYLGIFLGKIASGKNSKLFIKYYFGGIIIRLFFVLFLIFVVLKWFGINQISFLISFFIFYLFSVVLELTYLIKKSLKNY